MKTIFEVDVSTMANVTGTVSVTAGSYEQACERAIEHARQYGITATLDDDSIHWDEAYLPDPEEGVRQAPDVFTERGADEAPDRVTLVSVEGPGDFRALFVEGRFVQEENGADLTIIAENLARALGGRYRDITLTPDTPDWSWAELEYQLNNEPPKSESQLCEELERFCRESCLPELSADELNAMEGLTHPQYAFLERFIKRWDRFVEARD